jgi:hypothetical protein
MLTIQSESEIRDIVRLALLSEGIGDPETGASTEVGFARLFKDSNTRTSSELLSVQAANHMAECVIRPIQFTMTAEELEEMEGARELLESILSADRTGRIISSADSGTYIVASTGRIAEQIQSDTRLDSQAQAKLVSECLVDKMLVVMRLISGIIKVREDATLAQMKVDEQTKIEKAAREGREVKRSGDTRLEEEAKAKVREQAAPLIDARKRLSSILDRITSDYFASMAYYGNVLNAAGAFEFVGGQPNAERLATDSFDRMELRGAHSAYASLGRLIHPSYSGKSWHDINSSKGTAIDDKERVRQDKGFIQATINTFERLMYSQGLGVSRGEQGKGMPKPGSIADVTLIINMADEYNAAVAAARRAATGSTMVSASNVLRDFKRMSDADAERNASDAAARSIGGQAAMSREEARKAGASRAEARPDVQSALKRRAAEEAAEEAQRAAGGLTAGETRSVKSAQAEVEETLADGLRQVAQRLDGVGTGTLTGATPVERAHNAFIRPIALAMSPWCDVAYLATANSSRGGSRRTPTAILSQQQSESPEATGRILEDIISLSRADRSEERDDFFSAGLPEEEQVIKGVAPTRTAMRLRVTPRDIAAALKNVRQGEGGVSIARNVLNDRLAPYVIALGRAVLDARLRSGGGPGDVDKIKAHFSGIGCGNIAKLVKDLNDQIVSPKTTPSFTIVDPIKYLTGTPLEPVRSADVTAAESQHVSEEEVAETSAYRQAAEEFGESPDTMSATADEIRQGIADARRAELDRARPVRPDPTEYEDPFGGPIYRGPQNEALAMLQQLLQERAKKAARR